MKYRFVFLDGKSYEGEGDTAEQALMLLGFGKGACKALDYYEEIEEVSQ